MDHGPTEYSSSDLPLSYRAYADPQSEGASAAALEVRTSISFSPAATSTSDYGLHPASARSSHFPEYLSRPPYGSSPDTPSSPQRFARPSSTLSGSSGGMAQASSPSLPLADGQHHADHHHAQPLKSDPEVPIDPSIAASSPTYPPQGGQYSPYPPPDMAQAYPGHAGAGTMYGRPDWGQYGQPHPHGVPPYSTHSPSTTVSSASSAATAGARPGQVGYQDAAHQRYSHSQQQSHPLSQVYSFVPIPGAQQHKRPRRRYEEIERMYKCGWNGCEKAYGTLNHLNAHVTMQSHGSKRTPEEFKEIRKEWKARKKEEDNQRKAEEERHRVAAQANAADPQSATDPAAAGGAQAYPPGVRPQLPPIGYSPGQPGQAQGHYPAQPNGMEQMQQYNSNPLYSNYPQSPYAAQGNQMYQQHPDVPSNNYQQ